ncbi:MAG: hypothetical protein KGZ40_08120 [Clostridiales bacterium]|nr:hypothetical protein [Clostridiales bacterium]
MSARSFTVHMTGEHVLDYLPRLVVNEWFVLSGVQCALECNQPGVVGVHQKLVELLGVHWPRGDSRCGQGRQSSIGNVFRECGDGPFAGRVQCECLLD